MAGAAIKQVQGRTGRVAGNACRADAPLGKSLELSAMAQRTIDCRIPSCFVAVRRNAEPRNRVGGFLIVAVFTTLAQVTYGYVEPWIASRPCAKGHGVTSTASIEICLCIGAVQLGIGKGNYMRHGAI